MIIVMYILLLLLLLLLVVVLLLLKEPYQLQTRQSQLQLISFIDLNLQKCQTNGQ